MKTYFWRLIAFSMLYGICAQICPEKEHGYGRQLRLLGGVCMLLLVLSPIRALAQGGLDVVGALQEFFSSLEEQQTPEAEGDRYTQMDADLVAYAVKHGLCEHFSLLENDITVGVRLDEANESVETVTVGLSGQAIWQDSHAMEEWVQKNLGCRAEIYWK